MPVTDTPNLFESPAAPGAGGYALVAPERGLDAHGGVLTYSVPAHMRDLAIGQRVVVPLGRGDKGVTGYVIELMNHCDLRRVKPIRERDAQGVSITPDLIALAKWMAGYYCCPLGMVLATMLPAAVKHGTGSVRQWMVSLAEGKGDSTNAQSAPGQASDEAMITHPASSADDRPPLTSTPDKKRGGKSKPARLSPQQTAVLEQARLAQAAGETWTEMKRLADRAGLRTVQPVKQLIEKGLLTARRQSVIIPTEDRARRYMEPPRQITLNEDQAAAIDAISAAASQGFGVHLIHGVTGSGKTEVYLRVLGNVIANGDQRIANSEEGHQPSAISHQHGADQSRAQDAASQESDIRNQKSEIRNSSSPAPGAIILVPEISLTPQTVGRFMARFDSVAVLHSGMTESQRHHQWRRIRSGEARIVIGARSAVFAPMPRVGIIIVDEEHDNAYKQDQLPRYHARDVAIKRAQLLGVPVVLGSATPSLESYYNARGGDGEGPGQRAQGPTAGSDQGEERHQPSAISHQPEGEQARTSDSRQQTSDIHTKPSEIRDQRSEIRDSSRPRPRPRINPRMKYHLHRLPQRVGNLRLPKVEIVDLTLERRKRYEMTGSSGVHLLSMRLEAELRKMFGGAAARGEQRTANGGESRQLSAISSQHGANERRTSGTNHQDFEIRNQKSEIRNSSPQALLLLNRRGYANYIACPDQRCGWIMPCEYCDVTMVYHRDAALPLGGLVRCHHCTAEQLLPAQCPTCNRKVTVFGLGTQRVEEELQKKFPGARVKRMDSDSMRTGRDYHDTLEAFRKGEIDILVGTQMIAKGLDFPNVRLVGVISADTALHLPDFRASERTFQLVAQVAGRTGRGDEPGLVIVQTFNPSDRSIELAARHDYDTFAQQELSLRAQVGLPPITRMARIVVRDRDLVECTRQAAKLAEALHAANAKTKAAIPDGSGLAATGTLGGGGSAGGVRVRGPSPCSIARVGGFHRQQIELLAADASSLQRLMTALRNAKLLISDARTAVDVDPVVLI